MHSFFVLNNENELSVSENYAGYAVFYKKSNDKSVASIQEGLFSKLIENALKLSLDNFLLVDIATQPCRISVVKKSFKVEKCFLFGVSEREIGMNVDIPLYQLVNIAGLEFLKADAPEMLESDKNLKNRLWTQLQISFKLSK